MQSVPHYAVVKLKPCLSASDMKYVELQLANYLGPKARTLITHVASTTPGSHTLILTLADAVPNPAERDGFLSSCKFYLE